MRPSPGLDSDWLAESDRSELSVTCCVVLGQQESGSVRREREREDMERDILYTGKILIIHIDVNLTHLYII